MTEHESRFDRDRILETDADLHDQLATMLSRALRRQLWLFYLSEDHRIIDPIMPMNDHPWRPDEMCETGDLGRVTFARMFVARAGDVCELVGAGWIVVVQERLGPPRPTKMDLRWARAIAAGADRQGVGLRAQFILHSGGIRLLSEADARREVQAAARGEVQSEACGEATEEERAA